MKSGVVSNPTRRLQVTGRPSMAEVMAARAAREAAMAAGGASACSLEAKGECK